MENRIWRWAVFAGMVLIGLAAAVSGRYRPADCLPPFVCTVVDTWTGEVSVEYLPESEFDAAVSRAQGY